MRLNRVLALLVLAVATGIAVVWVEGHNLRLRQKLTELYRERQLLTNDQARLRLAVSRLAAPAQVIETMRDADTPLEGPKPTGANQPRAGAPPYWKR